MRQCTASRLRPQGREGNPWARTHPAGRKSLETGGLQWYIIPASASSAASFSIQTMSNDVHNDYRAIIQRSIADRFSWGVEVMAGRPGAALLHEAFGRAHRDPDRPLAMDAIFDMASVTKVVATATACSACIDDGLMAPHAQIRRYLPTLAREAGHVTIQDLATHVSGYDNSKPYMKGSPVGDELLRAMMAAKPVRPPGEQFCYACINFILLGFAVEAITGERLDRFCERRIFSPLRMADTRFGPVTEPTGRLVKMSNVEPGQISDDTARMAKTPIGNAGLFSTATDIARYCSMILCGGESDGGRVLSRESIALMKTRLSPAGCHPRSFGWNRGDDLRPEGFSQETIYHTGWTGQSVYIDPAQDAFVIVLTNRTGDHEKAMHVRKDIAAAVLGHVLDRRQ